MSDYTHPNARGMVITGQTKSIISVVAIVAAIVSFVFSYNAREFLALACAFVAIIAGMVGGVKALSPRVSGGMLSIIAVVLGVLGIIVAIIALIV